MYIQKRFYKIGDIRRPGGRDKPPTTDPGGAWMCKCRRQVSCNPSCPTCGGTPLISDTDIPQHRCRKCKTDKKTETMIVVVRSDHDKLYTEIWCTSGECISCKLGFQAPVPYDRRRCTLTKEGSRLFVSASVEGSDQFLLIGSEAVSGVLFDLDGESSLREIPVSWIGDGEPIQGSGRALDLVTRVAFSGG